MFSFQHNLIAPGKQPLSAMTPTIAYNKDKPCGVRLAIGGTNGSRIITGRRTWGRRWEGPRKKLHWLCYYAPARPLLLHCLARRYYIANQWFHLVKSSHVRVSTWCVWYCIGCGLTPFCYVSVFARSPDLFLRWCDAFGKCCVTILLVKLLHLAIHCAAFSYQTMHKEWSDICYVITV